MEAQPHSKTTWREMSIRQQSGGGRIKKVTAAGALLALLVFGLIIGFAPVAQASPYTVEIRITGSPGLSFSGSYGDLGGLRSVDGTVPATYTIVDPTYDMVSAVFQKQVEEGTLTVQLVKDGVVVASQTTTAAYGLVTVTYSFEEFEETIIGPFVDIMVIILLFTVFWFVIAILICVWVYRDAKARGENAALWLIIVLLFGIIGLIIWLIVRPKEKAAE